MPEALRRCSHTHRRPLSPQSLPFSKACLPPYAPGPCSARAGGAAGRRGHVARRPQPGGPGRRAGAAGGEGRGAAAAPLLLAARMLHARRLFRLLDISLRSAADRAGRPAAARPCTAEAGRQRRRGRQGCAGRHHWGADGAAGGADRVRLVPDVPLLHGGSGHRGGGGPAGPGHLSGCRRWRCQACLAPSALRAPASVHWAPWSQPAASCHPSLRPRACRSSSRPPSTPPARRTGPSMRRWRRPRRRSRPGWPS
jgi:hypothetical protein